MPVLKSFNELSNVIIPRAEKRVLVGVKTSTKGLSNPSQMADSHYFRNVIKCDCTELLLVHEKDKTAEIVVIPTFVFPNILKREYKGRLKAFRWTKGKKKSQLFNKIIATNKAILEDKIHLFSEFKEDKRGGGTLVEKYVTEANLWEVFEGRSRIEEALKVLWGKVFIKNYKVWG